MSFQPDHFERVARFFAADLRGHALNFQPELHIAFHRAVRQKRKILKHHRNLFPADLQKLFFLALGNIFPVDQHLA